MSQRSGESIFSHKKQIGSGASTKQERFTGHPSPEVSIQSHIEGIHALIANIIDHPELDPDAKQQLEAFADTQSMEILYAPIRKDGPKLATALDHIHALDMWNKLHNHGAALTQLLTTQITLPDQAPDNEFLDFTITPDVPLTGTDG